MRHKISIEERLERLEAKIKKTGYLIKINEKDEAYESIEYTLEELDNIRTLLNKETQD